MSARKRAQQLNPENEFDDSHQQSQKSSQKYQQANIVAINEEDEDQGSSIVSSILIKEKAEEDSKTTEEEILIKAQLQQNIQNAFLLLLDPKFEVEDATHRRNLKMMRLAFGISAYCIVIAQMTGLLLLAYVIEKENAYDLQLEDDEADISTLHKRKGKYFSYFLFPFILFGIMAIGKECENTSTDMKIFIEYYQIRNYIQDQFGHVLGYQVPSFVRWIADKVAALLPKYLSILPIALKKSIMTQSFSVKTHACILKFFELYIGSVMSCYYMYYLIAYSEINDWSDILNIILNLLAYQFVLDADEWAYECLAKNQIQEFLATIGSLAGDKKFFDRATEYPAMKKISISSFLTNFGLIISLCCMLQASLSYNKIMWWTSALVFCVFVLLRWIWSCISQR